MDWGIAMGVVTGVGSEVRHFALGDRITTSQASRTYADAFLVDADKAVYLVGSRLPPVMSRTSKYAYASREVAEAAKAEQGGEVTDFDGALKASYLDMAADTAMIRRKREERRAKAARGS